MMRGVARAGFAAVVVIASVVLQGCDQCQTSLQCGPGNRCMQDPVSLARRCGPPCSADADCKQRGVVCDSGSCIKAPALVQLSQPSGDQSLPAAASADTGPISGTLHFWGPSATLKVGVRRAPGNACFTGTWDFFRVTKYTNPLDENGDDTYSGEVAFTQAPLPVIPGTVTLYSLLTVPANPPETSTVERTITLPSCAGCPAVTLSAPASGATLGAGTMIASGVSAHIDDPNATCAHWTVVGENGEVSEGDAPVVNGEVGPLTLPLFPGNNRVRVETAGTGAPTGGCEVTVSTARDQPVALRAMLTWDGPGDMDLHVVRPGGTYSGHGAGSNTTDCHFANCKQGLPWGAGHAQLDVDNVVAYGPENIRLDRLENGTYGIAVNPFSGASNVTVRVFLGPALVGTFGPCHLDSPQELMVGTVTATSGTGQFRLLGQLTQGQPTTTPDQWLPGSGYGAGITATDCPPVTANLCQ